MPNELPPIESREEAIRIMKSGLGKAELEFAASVTAPLYWVIERGEGFRRVRNGSAFFIDTGEATFGVTACHVIEGLRKDHKTENVKACQIESYLPFDETRIIDESIDIDIATFDISRPEIESLHKSVLSGHQKVWPPSPPTIDSGVFFAGFAGTETQWETSEDIGFGTVCGSGIADSVSESDISTIFHREDSFDVMGKGFPSENYDFGGLSGGPLITMVEHNSIRSWRLGGVIYQGPNITTDERSIAGLEMFRARRADFIVADGNLDLSLWKNIHPI